MKKNYILILIVILLNSYLYSRTDTPITDDIIKILTRIEKIEFDNKNISGYIYFLNSFSLDYIKRFNNSYIVDYYYFINKDKYKMFYIQLYIENLDKYNYKEIRKILKSIIFIFSDNKNNLFKDFKYKLIYNGQFYGGTRNKYFLSCSYIVFLLNSFYKSIKEESLYFYVSEKTKFETLNKNKFILLNK